MSDNVEWIFAIVVFLAAIYFIYNGGNIYNCLHSWAERGKEKIRKNQ